MAGVCVELCSRDTDCPSPQKCCSNGCGHACNNPASTVIRPGECPKPPSDTAGVCAELCSRDTDCPSPQKCCFNGCGHACNNPALT
ncbi:UNVERIFIED_CONTAM: hypothetical protein B566_EDAN019028, partial [Ephemera danica]